MRNLFLMANIQRGLNSARVILSIRDAFPKSRHLVSETRVKIRYALLRLLSRIIRLNCEIQLNVSSPP